MKIKFLPDWKIILKKAWSIKVMLLAGLFSGLEFALPLLGDALPWDRATFAIVMFFVTAVAIVFRLLSQPSEK